MIAKGKLQVGGDGIFDISKSILEEQNPGWNKGVLKCLKSGWVANILEKACIIIVLFIIV